MIGFVVRHVVARSLQRLLDAVRRRRGLATTAQTEGRTWEREDLYDRQIGRWS